MIASFTLHFKIEQNVLCLFLSKIFLRRQKAMKDSTRFFRVSFGAVAQLVERMDGIHEVTGSIPVSSTNLRQGFGWQASFSIEFVF